MWFFINTISESWCNSDDMILVNTIINENQIKFNDDDDKNDNAI